MPIEEEERAEQQQDRRRLEELRRENRKGAQGIVCNQTVPHLFVPGGRAARERDGACGLREPSVAAAVEEAADPSERMTERHDDREEVAKTLMKYDFLALPVVDSEERLVGIVTVDDALDVISEETEEDFAKMAAITPSETPANFTGSSIGTNA